MWIIRTLTSVGEIQGSRTFIPGGHQIEYRQWTSAKDPETTNWCFLTSTDRPRTHADGKLEKFAVWLGWRPPNKYVDIFKMPTSQRDWKRQTLAEDSKIWYKFVYYIHNLCIYSIGDLHCMLQIDLISYTFCVLCTNKYSNLATCLVQTTFWGL